MTLNNNEIRVAANGRVYVAPKGTTLPTALAAPAAGFVDLGALSEDGATLSRESDQETVSIWQSSAPARYLVTGVSLSINMTLMQWNETTLPLFFGGGTVSSVAGPPVTYTYNIPSSADIDERVLLIEAFDGTTTYRFGFPRVMITSTDEMALRRTEASGLGLTFSVMAPADGGALGVVVSNDANLATA